MKNKPTASRRSVIKVYVRPDEKKDIQQRAQRLNRSTSEYLALAGTGRLHRVARTLTRVDVRMLNHELHACMVHMKRLEIGSMTERLSLVSKIEALMQRADRLLASLETTPSTHRRSLHAEGHSVRQRDTASERGEDAGRRRTLDGPGHEPPSNASETLHDGSTGRDGL